MPPDELTFRAMLAAQAAREEGFNGVADAFMVLARDFAFDALEIEHLIASTECSISGTCVKQVGTE